MNISLYSNVKSGGNVTSSLADIITIIKTETYGETIQKLRPLYDDFIAKEKVWNDSAEKMKYELMWPEERAKLPSPPMLKEMKAAKSLYTNAKLQLPAVSFAGTFKEGHTYEELTHYNNAIIIDVDKQTNAETIKEVVSKEEGVRLIFTSPSGHGIKILYQFKDTDGAIAKWNQELAEGTRSAAKGDWLARYHKAQYMTLEMLLKTKYNLETDSSGSDVCRMCFLSADKVLYENTEAVLLEPRKVEEKKASAITAPAPATLLVEKPKINSKKQKKEAEDEPWTLKQCEWHLDLIPCGEGCHDKWIKIGWSLYNAYKDEALPVFVKWSQANNRTEEDCLKKVWSYAKDDLGEPLTLDTIKFYYNEALEAWYKNNIYDDRKREGDLYNQFISLDTEGYLVKMIDGYKKQGKPDTTKAIHTWLLQQHVEPRPRAVDFIITNLYMVKEKYPYISVLPVGRHNLGGQNYLVEYDHRRIVPVKGEWTNISNTMATLPQKDREWFYTWLQHALKGFIGRDMTNKGQAITIIGKPDTAKSTVANIAGKLLGESAASIKDVVMKDVKFSRDMMMYPLWCIDDTLSRQAGTSVGTIHEKIRELFKTSTVEKNLSFVSKYGHNVVVGELFRRLIITLNDNEELMALMPEATDDIENKYSLLTCTKKFTKGTFDENLLWHELPAFAYYILNEWQKPDWIQQNTRMAIDAWHNEEVVKYIYNSSPEKKMLEDMRCWLESAQKYMIEGTATEIYNELVRIAGSYTIGNRPIKFTSPTSLGHHLGRLEKFAPDIVKKNIRDDANGARGWTITFPMTPAQKLMEAARHRPPITSYFTPEPKVQETF